MRCDEIEIGSRRRNASKIAWTGRLKPFAAPGVEDLRAFPLDSEGSMGSARIVAGCPQAERGAGCADERWGSGRYPGRASAKRLPHFILNCGVLYVIVVSTVIFGIFL